MTDGTQPVRKIIVRKNGPYTVVGNIPLVHKTQVSTEFGEPVAWWKDREISTADHSIDGCYDLCRCGHSKNKPFCDRSHLEVGFNGAETADTALSAQRRVRYGTGGKVFVRQDPSLCISSGFCGNRFTSIPRMARNSDDTQIHSLMLAMAERCPSGSYTYSFEQDGPDIEPDLPVQIAVTTEMTAQGPIIGSLWVTGYIPVERADGLPFETRNRVTLCRCGRSEMKPLCDGTHRLENIREE